MNKTMCYVLPVKYPLCGILFFSLHLYAVKATAINTLFYRAA